MTILIKQLVRSAVYLDKAAMMYFSQAVGRMSVSTRGENADD